MTAQEPPADRFTELVRQCPVLDLAGNMPLGDFFARAAETLSHRVNLSGDELSDLLIEREAESPTVLAPFLAIPHLIIPGQGCFDGLVARCRPGVRFNDNATAVHCIFVLVATREQRAWHLGALAAIAQLAQHPQFETRWLDAPDEVALRQAILTSRPCPD